MAASVRARDLPIAPNGRHALYGHGGADRVSLTIQSRPRSGHQLDQGRANTSTVMVAEPPAPVASSVTVRVKSHVVPGGKVCPPG